MDLPLDLGPVVLEQTPDKSRTMLKLNARTHDAIAWLDLEVVRQLAGALMQWLDDYGHVLPDAPAGWRLVEVEPLQLDDDEDEAQPATMPDTFGQLVLRAQHHSSDGFTMPTESPLIERADPWVLMSMELWEQCEAGLPYASVKGDLLTINDSRGTTVRYGRRRDVPRPAGMLVLERTYLSPDLSAIPEHSRG